MGKSFEFLSRIGVAAMVVMMVIVLGVQAWLWFDGLDEGFPGRST